MKLMEIKQVETILHNNVKISEFADLHNVSEEVAKKILERLLEKPETTAEFKKYIFSTEHSDNLKKNISAKPQKEDNSRFAKNTTPSFWEVLTTSGMKLLTGRK